MRKATTLTGDELRDRLMRDVEMIPHSGCWIWMGGTSTAGYGYVYLGCEGKKQIRGRAHRLMHRAVHGEIPAGMHVLHRCDVPPCINPDHLFLGTDGDNQRDAAQKGRTARHLGEFNGNARLTTGQVGEIRSRYAEGGVTQRELAEEYGVSQANISLIVNNEAWGHL